MLKYNIMRGLWWLLAALACCAPATLRAQDTVNVERAGTLHSLISGNETKLTLTGSINGTDVKYLRQLTNEGRLTALDLGTVRIVGGGTAYYNNYRTEADVVGECMFTECRNLREVVLPSTAGTIGSNAFSRSGLRKVDIPEGVTRLGMDAFAYCDQLAEVVIGSRVAQLDQGVFYSSPVRTACVKPLTPPATPPYLFSSNPTIRVYSEVLNDYKQSTWKQFGTITGRLEALYPMAADESAVVNGLSETFFEDAACTRLKAACQAMTDDELAGAMGEAGMPQFMAEIALKLKNGDWAPYEQDFRIHSYGAYSDASYWNDKMKSTGGSFMGNPTGIYAKGTERLYVFVDEDVPQDATLYIAGCTDNTLITSAKTGKRLAKGLNIVDGQKGALYYILYTADTRRMTRTLDEWPEIKIHIEGGTVNGYYDASRHSDADYRAILKAATHERFTVRGGQALFNFKTTTYRKVWPTTIDRSICWYDSLTVWEKELMGFCQSVAAGQRAATPHCLSGGEAVFPLYYNNPNFAIEGVEADAGWANSTPYRTSYNSVECIRASFDVSRADHDDWCSAHECGHNNQGVINLEGGTEVSNNLFSNVVRYLTGRVTSVGSPLSTVMNEYARHTPFFVRDVNSQLRMYYQLYLYYHQAQRNTAFYPNLFRELRRDPLGTRYGNAYQTSLKFVRKVCEVAQEDLTDFFTAWGFFEPCTNLSIEDYGAHRMTVRQADIDRTKAEIAKYPRKNRTILFVEDRADYVPTRDYLTTGGKKRRDSEQVGQCGELGQFTSYMPDAAAQPSSYTYLQTDSLYAMAGTGGVGFLALDGEGRMRYASNSLCFCIPTSIGNDFSLYSIDADGTLHEAVRAGNGAVEVRLERAGTLGDSLPATAIKAIIGGAINGTDIKYMRQCIGEGNLSALDLTDAKVSSGGLAYYENYRSATNAIGNHAFYGLKKLISVGLPQSITKIEGNAFARSGIREIRIPDGVTTIGGDAFAYCDQLTRVVIGSKVRTMEQGVFYSSAVRHAYVKAATPPSVAAYLFSSKPVIHVYAKSLAAYKASAWAQFGELVGDLDDYEDLTGLEETVRDFLPAPSAPAHFFDMQGRRASRMQPGSIYIRRGKKVLYK